VPFSLLSLLQKLIDVQQTLIRNPNPLKNNFPVITGAFNPGKTKDPISVNFFFLNSILFEKYKS
jgi:hypothetical protein